MTNICNAHSGKIQNDTICSIICNAHCGKTQTSEHMYYMYYILQ